MSYNFENLMALLKQLKESKANLIATLETKGEEVPANASFSELIRQAADYTPKSYILIDADGNEIPGVLVDEETIFTAEEVDVRKGKVFVNDTGVKTGTKIIPSYNTTEGFIGIPPGGRMKVTLNDERDLYDYTKFQAIICPYNTTIADSVSAEKIAINDKVHNVLSTDVVGIITKDAGSASIDFGINNDTGTMAIIYYFTYKEIY